MRVLSGIQPTGRPHWGNYFGAIRQYIDLQEENDGVYFIADLHALTTIRDPEKLSTIAAERKSSMLLLPYGIPLAIGTIAYFAYTGMLL